ncbi:MAG: hypothetical protein AB7S69_18325 [Salinivirgaceae bacterium]|jgi:hypothetical protein
MRNELKIALGLFAVNTTLGHLWDLPEFIRGLLLGLSLFFMVLGLLPEKSYAKLKTRQALKLSLLKRLVKSEK